jgi:hypothetical protein
VQVAGAGMHHRPCRCVSRSIKLARQCMAVRSIASSSIQVPLQCVSYPLRDEIKYALTTAPENGLINTHYINCSSSQFRNRSMLICRRTDHARFAG